MFLFIFDLRYGVGGQWHLLGLNLANEIASCVPYISLLNTLCRALFARRMWWQDHPWRKANVRPRCVWSWTSPAVYVCLLACVRVIATISWSVVFFFLAMYVFFLLKNSGLQRLVCVLFLKYVAPLNRAYLSEWIIQVKVFSGIFSFHCFAFRDWLWCCVVCTLINLSPIFTHAISLFVSNFLQRSFAPS